LTAIVAVLWIGIAIAVGSAANARGRSGGGWFLLALIFSPIIALLFLIAFPARAIRTDAVDDAALRRALNPPTPTSQWRIFAVAIISATIVGLLIAGWK
jgi:phosphotransferase system  glucose/maltose/N-acetylglucosamine-specific IIC component